MSRSAATSRRRSSTLSSMMQSRKIALATMVITPMARWKRDTTAKVFDVSTATSAERWARKPNADALMRATASRVASGDRAWRWRSGRRDRRSRGATAAGRDAADAILAARDLGGIGATLHDGGDDDGVARLAGSGGDDDAIADVELRVGGEAAVYRDRAWRVLRAATHGARRVLRRCGARRGSEQRGGVRVGRSRRRGTNARAAARVPRDDAQRCRAALAQCAVSASAPRVSASVYDGSAYVDSPRLSSQAPTASSMTR